MEHSKIIPEINCSVTQCTYNAMQKCAASSIIVSEKSQSSADCVTFKPKNEE